MESVLLSEHWMSHFAWFYIINNQKIEQYLSTEHAVAKIIVIIK